MNVEPETTPLAVVQLVVAVTAVALEPLPSATELASETMLPLPMDTALLALALAPAPDVVPLAPPIAMELVPLAELFRPKHQPPAPIQSATERTAEVIDLAAWRRRKSEAKE